MAAPATAEAIRDVNTRYHDDAAASYDAKWGIDFGPIGFQQVWTKMRKAMGTEPPVFADALEIGAGTGYFSLNLALAGKVRRATCTDISPGMLDVLCGQRRAPRPRRSHGGVRRRRAALRGRRLRPRPRATPSCTTSPT
jgi:ubiquinone/menaquinone biosynthesis C-methylase UbiE